ncbi:MAG: peptidoglycan-binding domain-containing protein [Methyloligellaceae bacterium]
MAILLRGLRGEPVRRLQEKLGVEADGVFGGGTEQALKDYQKENGLKVDGIAGPDTFAHMALYDLVLLRRGTRGDTVKAMQEKLGIDADGKFGSGTEKAVEAFQTENGLKADGMVGPDTLAKLELFSEPAAKAVLADAAEAAESAWDTIEEAAEGAIAKVKSMFGF